MDSSPSLAWFHPKVSFYHYHLYYFKLGIRVTISRGGHAVFEGEPAPRSSSDLSRKWATG